MKRDGIDSTEAASLWSQARAAAEESFDALNDVLRRTTTNLGPAEGKGIRDFTRTACKHTEAFRFTLLGLPKPDVLLYFTPTYLSPVMPHTWDEVAGALGDPSTGVATGTWKPDKKQLTARFGFDADEDLTEAARKTLRHSGLHTDFFDLLRHIDAHMDKINQKAAQM